MLGNNIATSVIATRLGKLKAKARALNGGAIPTVTAVAPSISKRNRPTEKATTGINKKVKKESTGAEVDSANGVLRAEVENPGDDRITPPTTPGQKPTKAPSNPIKATTPTPIGGSKATNGHVGSKRCSPRDSEKQNYRKLDDPFVFMDEAVGSDGDNVFGQAVRPESQDSFDSDKDFNAEKSSA